MTGLVLLDWHQQVQ